MFLIRSNKSSMPRFGLNTGLAIRLARRGCRNRPFFHLIVQNAHRNPDTGVVLEQLGSYDPMVNQNGEKLVSINFDRLKYFYAGGAKLHSDVAEILGLSGFFPIYPKTIINARHKRAGLLKDEEPSEHILHKQLKNYMEKQYRE